MPFRRPADRPAMSIGIGLSQRHLRIRIDGRKALYRGREEAIQKQEQSREEPANPVPDHRILFVPWRAFTD